MQANQESTEWVIAPTQDRSRETERAIREAVLELLGEMPFEKVKIADIADRAGVAVGTLYRRFRNKSALLHLLHTHLLDDSLSVLNDRMSMQRLKHKTASQVVNTYVDIMIQLFRKHRNAMLAVMRNAGSEESAVIAERNARFNEQVHGHLKQLLQERITDMARPQLLRTLNMAIFIASAAAREAIWHDKLLRYPVQFTDQQLAREIALNFRRYLGVE